MKMLNILVAWLFLLSPIGIINAHSHVQRHHEHEGELDASIHALTHSSVVALRLRSQFHQQQNHEHEQHHQHAMYHDQRVQTGCGVCDASSTTKGIKKLYHYTTKAALKEIIKNGVVKFKFSSQNLKMAKFGWGVYFTGLCPWSNTIGEVAFGNFQKSGIIPATPWSDESQTVQEKVHGASPIPKYRTKLDVVIIIDLDVAAAQLQSPTGASTCDLASSQTYTWCDVSGTTLAQDSTSHKQRSIQLLYYGPATPQTRTTDRLVTFATGYDSPQVKYIPGVVKIATCDLATPFVWGDDTQHP